MEENGTRSWQMACFVPNICAVVTHYSTRVTACIASLHVKTLYFSQRVPNVFLRLSNKVCFPTVVFIWNIRLRNIELKIIPVWRSLLKIEEKLIIPKISPYFESYYERKIKQNVKIRVFLGVTLCRWRNSSWRFEGSWRPYHLNCLKQRTKALRVLRNVTKRFTQQNSVISQKKRTSARPLV